MIMAMKDEAGRRMLSCAQAAKEYGCTMRYIRKLAQTGRIPFEVVGGTYMVPADEVRKLSKRKATGRERKRAEGYKPG
jgi:excisionase family DNA binding protein